jgi:hypothetical protein
MNKEQKGEEEEGEREKMIKSIFPVAFADDDQFIMNRRGHRGEETPGASDFFSKWGPERVSSQRPPHFPRRPFMTAAPLIGF